MKRLPILFSLLVLVACGGSDPAPAPGEGATASVPAEAPAGAIQAGLRWATQVGGSGVSLTLFEANGDALLRLACVRSPNEMVVTGERFTPIASEERLTLGAGGGAHAFVADPTADRPSGVEARGPIPPGLLDGLAEATEVSAVYGAQKIGPHIPPDPQMAQAFVSACRQLSAGSPEAGA
jgi:hypothetical protein